MTDIAIIGEAWGEAELRERAPFVGASGYELTRMLNDAGINRADCFLTNTFNLHPPANKIESFCGGKDTALEGYPALIKGKFVRKEFESELRRLANELLEMDTNVVICLGNTALWAMAGITAISKLRGSTRISTHTVRDFKLLPTYHPAAVLRQWELRPIVVADLIKAKRESTYPEIRRPQRQVFIPETVEDLYAYHSAHIERCTRLTVDIETVGQQITCIGFAPTPRSALVIPFVDGRRTGRSYWPNRESECEAWLFVSSVLGNKNPKKTFQNGLYDISFLLRSYGIKVMGAEHDTMLLHHALQPESLKGLGFLGSIYCDEGNWKQMREKHTTIKRDD